MFIIILPIVGAICGGAWLALAGFVAGLLLDGYLSGYFE